MNAYDTTPLISVITVCYNAVATIGRTVASVDAQTFGDYEHLIVDGASGDETLKICDTGNGRRRIISEPDEGLYDAMNKGIDRSTGQYIVFLNAGDKLHAADTLQRVADAIAANDSPGVVYGQTLIVDDNGERISERHLIAPEELNLRSFAEGMMVCHQAFYALRKIVSGYNREFKYSADYEWCIRVLQHSRRNAYIPDYLCDYLSEGITTRHRRASLMERFRIMCRYYGVWSAVTTHIRKLFCR